MPKARTKNDNSISKLKKRVWVVVSQYIRLKYSDFRGYCKCVTCNVVKPYTQLQAGHFVQGRRNGVLFDERNIHPQCYICNVCKHGDLLNYRDFMLKTYGEDVINELRALDQESKQFTVPELKALKEIYSNKLLELQHEHRLPQTEV
jgi:hypothetical protein